MQHAKFQLNWPYSSESYLSLAKTRLQSLQMTLESCPVYAFQVLFESLQKIMSYSCMSKLGSAALELIDM